MQPPSLADAIARLHAATAVAAPVWLPAALHALLIACLARLFSRLEHIVLLWQSGRLALPPASCKSPHAEAARPASPRREPDRAARPPMRVAAPGRGAAGPDRTDPFIGFPAACRTGTPSPKHPPRKHPSARHASARHASARHASAKRPPGTRPRGMCPCASRPGVGTQARPPHRAIATPPPPRLARAPPPCTVQPVAGLAGPIHDAIVTITQIICPRPRKPHPWRSRRLRRRQPGG